MTTQTTAMGRSRGSGRCYQESGNRPVNDAWIAHLVQSEPGHCCSDEKLEGEEGIDGGERWEQDNGGFRPLLAAIYSGAMPGNDSC